MPQPSPWSRVFPLTVLAVLLVSGRAQGAAQGDPEAFAKCQEKKSCTAAIVQGTVSERLDGFQVTAAVIALGNNKFSVKLTGDVEDAATGAKLEAAVKALGENLNVLSAIQVVEPPAPQTDIWFLTYLGQALDQTQASAPGKSDEKPAGTAGAGKDAKAADAAETAKKSAISAWADAFEATHKGSKIHLAGNNRLLLAGDADQIVEMKRQLALIDTPYPQVQLNLWAVQVSGSDKCIAERTAWIQQRIRTTRDRINQLKARLKDQVRWDCEPGQCGGRRAAIDQMAGRIGLKLDARSSLSLNEALILLLVDEHGQDTVQKLQAATLVLQNQWKGADAALFQKTHECLKLPLSPPAPRDSFQRLAQLVKGSSKAHFQDFTDFLEALAQFRNQKDGDAPRNLSRKGVAVDRLLKDAMDAFSEDTNELLFDPLLAELRQLAVPRCGDDGIALVGQSRIVVTSTQHSTLEAEMSSAVETTRPTPFGQALLDKAKTLATPATNPTPIDAAVGALSNAQTFLLAAALLQEPQPTFTEIAPGISIDVRPTVLPDGGAARLKIDASFGVGTSALNSDPQRTDVWAQAPPSAVSKHHVVTDASIETFDLFNLSSFSIQTTAPQRPFYIPVLARIPILGPMFQFPRSPKVTRHESLILANTVILPRSVELHRFYTDDKPYLGNPATP